MRRHFWTYLALTTMAVAQPILDLYGKNITVFSAAKLSRVEVALFLALVLLVPAVLAMGLDSFSRLFGPRVNESMRILLVSGLSGVLGFAVARWVKIDGSKGALALALAFAVLLPWAFDKSKAVREWSRWLAVLALVVGANAVVQLRPVLSSARGPASDAVVGRTDVSVLQIVFDEFPLYALLGPDGRINSERFPGFAQLAGGSTWYRNSVAASNFTHQAVPAVLSSSMPKMKGGPFLYEYPRNIFTLFAGQTTVDGIEPVTSLCPVRVCGESLNAGGTLDTTRFSNFVKDAGTVYGQRVLPPFLRKYVPSTEGTWGGFAAVAGKFKDQFELGVFGQPNALLKGVDDLIADPKPRVESVHVLLPHAPWRLTADGRVAPLSKEISTTNPGDQDGVRDTYQTFLHQLGATDSAMSEVIRKLKDAGRWDDTMIVVTADHGISFLPGLQQRHTRFGKLFQSEDVFRVPTFIKYPGQATGRTSDCAITNFDLLPTIIDATDTTTSWTFEGQSVAGECPAGRERKVRSATGESAVLSRGFEVVRERAAYYATVVSNVGPMSKVSAVGASAPLIGTTLDGAVDGDGSTTWVVDQESWFRKVKGTPGSRVPSLITGVVTTTSGFAKGTEGIVTIDGVAAGVLGELSGKSGRVRYTAILDYSLLDAGAHTVELYLRSANGDLTRIGPPA